VDNNWGNNLGSRLEMHSRLHHLIRDAILIFVERLILIFSSPYRWIVPSLDDFHQS